MVKILSEDVRKFITAQNKKRLKGAKILSWFFVPFAILFIYAFVKVLQEEDFSSLLAERGGIVGIIFVIIATFTALYFFLSFIKLKSEVKNSPEFQISAVEGVPKLKESYYRHSFRSPSGAIYGAMQQISFTGTINGVKYNFSAVSPDMIGSAPIRVTAVTRRSWLFLCDWKNFAVEIQELSAEEIKKYEDTQLKDWPDEECVAAIPLNAGGRLSDGQIKALKVNNFKGILLWLGLLAGSIFLLSLSGWYFLAGDKNTGMSVVIVILLVIPALIAFGASVWGLVTDIFSKSAAQLPVQSFTGAVKKTRPATYSEYQRSNRELVTAPTVIFDGSMYFVLPEKLFDKIPATREMKYYYVQKDKEKFGTIVNFSRP